MSAKPADCAPSRLGNRRAYSSTARTAMPTTLYPSLNLPTRSPERGPNRVAEKVGSFRQTSGGARRLQHPAILSTRALSLIRLGRRVLDRIDLQVAPREIVSLVGPTNAGKTAVLDCLLGLHPNASGGMSIEGFNPAFDPGIALSYISFVPSEIHFPTDVTGLTQAKGHCRRLGRNIPENALRGLLELGGLGREWHGRPIGHYPPSLRRKLALSLAILEDRPLLLLEEPTTDLDASEVAALALAVRRLRRRGAAILIATGDLTFARRVSTRILHLENGMVLETTEVTSSRRAHRETSYLAQLV